MAPSLALLIVDDDDAFRAVLARRFQRRGHQLCDTGSPKQALELVAQRHFDVAILDLSMPEMDGVTLLEKIKQAAPETQVIMLTGQGTLETAVRAMKLGAYDYLTKPCDLADLEMHVLRAAEKEVLARENRNLRAMIARQQGPQARFVGHSPALQALLRLIERVAPTSSPVLIQGESGSGKELVARCIHQLSPRAERPLVTVNCAALQESLLESELFGHEKGAFTSAMQCKPGLFEVASGGTLFIDEIGELAPALQAKLLRVLEDGMVRRVGSVKDLKTDVRIVAATNRDLAAEVAARRFRDDLYFRLNVITIEVPPLRKRLDDLPELVQHFLHQGGPGPTVIDPDALVALHGHHWPGNIRELANVIMRAKILAEGRTIGRCDLPASVLGQASAAAADANVGRVPAQAGNRLAHQEAELVRAALAAHHGNKAHAAKALGVSRRKLYRLLERHGLDASS